MKPSFVKWSYSGKLWIIILLLWTWLLALPGQSITSACINGLTWQVVNAPAYDVFNFQYNDVKKVSQLIVYRNGMKIMTAEYRILRKHHHKTILRIMLPYKSIDYVVSNTIWNQGFLMGFRLTDLSCHSVITLTRQTSLAPPLFYGID